MKQSLSHFTNSIDAVVGILAHGFAWQRNDREVISNLLPGIDFSDREPQSFGQVCFTENSYETDRDQTKFFGRFGIQVSTAWAQRNNAQPVIYLPDKGPLVDVFQSLFVQSYENAVTEEEYPDDTALRGWRTNAAMAGFAGQHIYRCLLRLYEFMEPAKHSNEREWRIVNPMPNYSISNLTEDAIKEVSPPLGWAIHVNVVKVEPPDVAALICPQADKNDLEQRLPQDFEEVPIDVR